MAKQENEIKTASDLKQDEHNYRKHSDTNKARIKKSIDEAGLGRSVVIDADGVLVAGNGVQSVIDGNTPVKVVETDGTELVVVKRTDLHTGDPRRKTLALADNATADDVEWNIDAIAEDWSQDEAGEWGVDWPSDEEAEQSDAQEDDFDDTVDKVETVCKEGDIWKLGNHRLMCGDSTDADSVALLMDGEKADLWLTDPPYNVSYEGGTSEKLTIMNDNMVDEKFRAFLLDAFMAATDVMKPGAAFYIWHADSEGFNFRYAVKSADLLLKQCLIWNKNQLVMGRQDYQWKHEPCLYGWKDGGSHNWYSDRKQTTVLNFDKPLRNADHPTMKPVPLFGYLIQNSSKDGDIILDTFGGSGTTLIAAEQLNRRCFMMELDPHYCDVIIARWEKLTGNKAEKI